MTDDQKPSMTSPSTRQPNPANLGRAHLLRGALAAAGLTTLPHGLSASAPSPRPMNVRLIPSTREALPVIGCGTYVGFDRSPRDAEYAMLPAVLGALFEAGGRLIDSSPMYGRAEASVGELLAASPPTVPAFLATKVWTSGREAGVRQMTESMRLMRTERIDLMQIHNLLDWRIHLETLRRWKHEGRVRYIGITHYNASAYEQVEAVLRAETLDFLQINYALDEREAAERLLPLAADRGVAVIVNRPFGGGGLLRRVAAKPMPGWADEIGCTSWAQLLLKFVLSHPAVTCAIPGSGHRAHMADNAAAGSDPVPPLSFWTDKLAVIQG